MSAPTIGGRPLHLLGDRVACRRAASPGSTGRLHIPEALRGLAHEGVVIALGDEVFVDGLEVGASVVWRRFEEHLLEDDAGPYQVVSVDDILGFVGPEAPGDR
jgi:co-chaperonin GroES (HSP10)